MSCHVISCHFMSWHVMTCHDMTCHDMTCHVVDEPSIKAKARKNSKSRSDFEFFRVRCFWSWSPREGPWEAWEGRKRDFQHFLNMLQNSWNTNPEGEIDPAEKEFQGLVPWNAIFKVFVKILPPLPNLLSHMVWLYGYTHKKEISESPMSKIKEPKW